MAPHGGACVDLKEIATRLKSRGYDIRLVVPEYDGIFPRGSVDRELLSVETHKVPFSSKTFNRFFLPRRIGAKVEALSPDFVYLGDSYFLKPFLYRALQNHRVISRFYTYELLCPNYYLLYKNGKKCTLNYLDTPLDCVSCALEGMKKNIQSLDLEVWSHEFLMSLGFLPSYNQFVKDSFSFCETLITYNDLASSLLSPFHPDVKTFPGGVDTGNFFHVQRPIKRVKRILLTGRLMDPRKGLLFFIENIRKLRRERGDFDVVITYDQNFGEDYIKSLGWVNHSAIKSLYNDVDICVVPSLWEEPFGMVALEAMASGKPVVASAVSGLRMSVDDGVTGFLFPSGDGPKMIEALNTLLDSPELMTSMGAAGRKRAEKYFDWERVVDRYCDEVFERG
ncbi:MAG: glycosyltransferase family 4 protein [Nitrospinota bacterium]